MLDHGRPEDLAGQQRPQKIVIHDLPQGLLRQLEDVYAIGEGGLWYVPAGRIYEDIQPSPALEQGISGPFELVPVEHVGRESERCSTLRLYVSGDPAGPLFATSEHSYPRIAAGEGAGHLSAEHTGRAGDPLP